MERGAHYWLGLGLMTASLVVPRAWPCTPKPERRGPFGCGGGDAAVEAEVSVSPALTDLGTLVLGEEASFDLEVAHHDGPPARVALQHVPIVGSGFALVPFDEPIDPGRSARALGTFQAVVEGPTVLEIEVWIDGETGPFLAHSVFVRAWVQPGSCTTEDVDCDGLLSAAGDCNDANVWMSADPPYGELCDSLDNDCDGEVDEGCDTSTCG